MTQLPNAIERLFQRCESLVDSRLGRGHVRAQQLELYTRRRERRPHVIVERTPGANQGCPRLDTERG